MAKPEAMTETRAQAEGRQARAQRALRMIAVLLCISLGSVTHACDSDADCGPGGTCIKREKRARGVCYGRADDAATAPDQAGPSVIYPPDAGLPRSGDAASALPAPVTGERREHATGWMGDPEQRIRDAVPNAELGGVCIVSSDCADGWECIVAGFEGRCVRQ